MARITLYVDGFNLYHSLEKQQRWLDLEKLAKQIINTENHEVKIKYFSAYHWDSDKRTRHKTLIAVYKYLNIEVILGRFKEKYPRCLLCHKKYKAHEEKETDVNIAIHLLNDAMHDEYDIAYILSADTDLHPAIDMVLKEFPLKKVTIAVPPNSIAEHAKAKYKVFKIKSEMLTQSILPNPYRTLSGAYYNAPGGWC